MLSKKYEIINIISTELERMKILLIVLGCSFLLSSMLITSIGLIDSEHRIQLLRYSLIVHLVVIYLYKIIQMHQADKVRMWMLLPVSRCAVAWSRLLLFILISTSVIAIYSMFRLIVVTGDKLAWELLQIFNMCLILNGFTIYLDSGRRPRQLRSPYYYIAIFVSISFFAGVIAGYFKESMKNMDEGGSYNSIDTFILMLIDKFHLLKTGFLSLSGVVIMLGLGVIISSFNLYNFRVRKSYLE
ncbi:hypothetical protein KAR48_00155 [bacterium]|nr:hypothetical protein [bacterium]